MTDTKLTIELHTPETVTQSIKDVNFSEIDDVTRIRVMLFSGDAAQGGEFFQAIADAELTMPIFEALRDNMPSDNSGIDVKRFELVTDSEFFRAFNLASADVAAGNLREAELNILILLETDNDMAMLNKALLRVQDRHYITAILKVKPCL